MKVIFAGTPEFAAVALKALCLAGHEVQMVLTQPDRPAGRGMCLQASPVKRLALQNGLTVLQPQTLRDEIIQDQLRSVAADVMLVAAYGLILPRAVLDIPRLGCLNIHASLLPRWRGAAPIQRAILAGDAETGVCIMQMEAGLDTGPVLSRAALAIAARDTAGSLHDRLARLGAELAVRTLADLPLPAMSQPAEGVSYATKIEKAEARIDWGLSARELDCRIRAFNPYPGAFTFWNSSNVKIWTAQPVLQSGPPGKILAIDQEGIVVACGDGALRITELQKAGSKRLMATQFLAGHVLRAGEILGSA